MLVLRKLLFLLAGVIILLIYIFYLNKINRVNKVYTIYQFEIRNKFRREEIYAFDNFNFTIVYFSGNGWQKSDSVIYQKIGEYTLIREFLACYDENPFRFKGFQFEASYQDFGDSLTAKYFINEHQYFPKIIVERTQNAHYKFY